METLTNHLNDRLLTFPDVRFRRCIGKEVKFMNLLLSHQDGQFYCRKIYRGLDADSMLFHPLDAEETIIKALSNALYGCSQIDAFNHHLRFLYHIATFHQVGDDVVSDRFHQFFKEMGLNTLPHRLNQTDYSRVRQQFIDKHHWTAPFIPRKRSRSVDSDDDVDDETEIHGRQSKWPRTTLVPDCID